jgi:hypothetical protein
VSNQNSQNDSDIDETEWINVGGRVRNQLLISSRLIRRVGELAYNYCGGNPHIVDEAAGSAK